MNNQFIQARELIAKAREALRRGDKASARQLGEQAAYLAPAMEDVWLILTASDPNAHEALAYAQKALELNPQSARAQRAVEWAKERSKQTQGSQEPPPALLAVHQAEAVSGLPASLPSSSPARGPQKRAYQTAVAMPQLQSNGRNWLLPALLIGAAFLFIGFIVLFALTRPALASIVSSVSAPMPTQENLWAPAEIAKPGVAPVDGDVLAAQVADTPTPIPTEAPTLVPTDVPTQAPTVTPAITETPGSMVMEIVADTPTSEYVAPTYSAPKEQIASSGNGVRWIDVDLTNQRVYAYEGDVVVNSFIVSTGTAYTPTVTGKFKIYIKLVSGSMRGPGYFLPDVPYIMYFHKSYGLHGTYWHSNFGTPMSHGCVNLSIPDAEWLYNWSYLGTVVNVHH